jgi:hypothetical protein
MVTDEQVNGCSRRRHMFPHCRENHLLFRREVTAKFRAVDILHPFGLKIAIMRPAVRQERLLALPEAQRQRKRVVVIL